MEQHSRLPSGDFPCLRASRTNMGLLIHVSTQAFFRTFADWVNLLYNAFTLKQEVSNMEIAYIKCGDYYIPDLTLPEEPRPMGKWGRMHREYLKATYPITYTNLILSGKLWTYLADLNEQAQLRLDTLVSPDEGCRRNHRSTESQRPDAMGAADEQHPGQGGGNSP